MNFKKSYKSENGYTKISKIGESSLKKLEFGIIELKAGEALDFYKACVFSSGVSALKCTKVGARTGVPTFDEVIKFLKENSYEL